MEELQRLFVSKAFYICFFQTKMVRSKILMTALVCHFTVSVTRPSEFFLSLLK